MSETQQQQQQEKPADAWGQPISEEQQAELQGYLDRWTAETDHSGRKGPFDGVKLTGVEVFWLAEQSGRDLDGSVPNLHLERADLTGAHLAGASHNSAHLEGATLNSVHLEGANLGGAHLEGAILVGASLDKVTALKDSILTGVLLDQATFDNTNLSVVDWRAVPKLGDELHAR